MDGLNVGFVLYTRSDVPGALDARWTYENAYSGPGIATGGPEDGFAGRFPHVCVHESLFFPTESI